MFHAWERNSHRILIGKHVGKRKLTKSRSWWENNIKMKLIEMGTSLMWLRIGASRVLLRAWEWNFRFSHKMLRIRVAHQQLDFQEGRSSSDVVSFTSYNIRSDDKFYENFCTVSGYKNFLLLCAWTNFGVLQLKPFIQNDHLVCSTIPPVVANR
jgi:hypothetical protein